MGKAQRVASVVVERVGLGPCVLWALEALNYAETGGIGVGDHVSVFIS